MLNFYSFLSAVPFPYNGESIFTAREDCKRLKREGWETRPFVFEFQGSEENKMEIVELIKTNSANLILNPQSGFRFEGDNCADYLLHLHDGIGNMLFPEGFELELKNITITIEIATSLSKIIKNRNCPKGFCLFFYRCRWTEESMHILAQSIDKKNTIERFVLFIDECNLTNSLSSMLFERVDNFPKDFILSLSRNEIDAEGILPLVKSLGLAQRKLGFTLNLRANPIGDKGAAWIFQAIKQSKTLRELNLDLTKTGLTDASVVSLIDLCDQWNDNLRYLRCKLINNKAITSDSVYKMIEALKKNLLMEVALGGSHLTPFQCPELRILDLIGIKNQLLQKYLTYAGLIIKIAKQYDLHVPNFKSPPNASLLLLDPPLNAHEVDVIEENVPLQIKVFEQGANQMVHFLQKTQSPFDKYGLHH